MNATEAKAQLWELGVIAPWYLREDQKPLYELLLSDKRPFIECARRYGKTTTILCYVLEQLLRNPGWVCLWCEPDKNQAREIVKPEIDKLFATAPDSLAPEWSSEDSFYWFPSTGNRKSASKLKLRGINHDCGDSARGPFAHIVVADEYGFWKDPSYTVREALAPQLLTTKGALIKASTPPEDLGHVYYDDKGEAINAGRFIQRTVHDNKSLDAEQFAQIVIDCGGEHTPAFKREYLCQPVSDPERLVIPEYQESVHDVEDHYERPECFDAYVGIDLGFNDSTAALFGYWDFKKQELVIEGEYCANGRNSSEIVGYCRGLERYLWGTLECRCQLNYNGTGMKTCHYHGVQPYRRIADNDLQQLHDMHSMLGYTVDPTAKDDKLAAINDLRLRFGAGKIKIKKRCKSLRYQLKVGLWNDRRTDFQRGEKTGHLDAVAALIYLHRNINVHHNPYPTYGADVSKFTHFIPALPGSQGSDLSGLTAAFQPFGSITGGRK